jgi:putative membrane protein
MLQNKLIPASYIIKEGNYHLAYVLFVSVLAFFITEKFQDFLPEMPLTIPAFFGTTISILLSFNMTAGGKPVKYRVLS